MKTKQLLLPSVMVFVALFNASCFSEWNAISGKGSIVSETRQAENFTSIELQSAANVEIVKGESYNVMVSDYENLVQYLTLEVINNRLVIKKDPLSVNLWNSKAKVTVTMPDSLYAVTLAGSGEMRIDPAFSKLQSLRLNGSGSILIEDYCALDKLEAQITGSGNIRAKGTVNNLTAKITGSGNMMLSGLEAYDAKCTLSGSGNIHVAVENELVVYLSGSGDVFYYGNPTVNSYASGSGKVYKR